MLDIAEKLCFNPKQCLTTIFADDYTKVVRHLEQVQYANFQVNVMMVPSSGRLNQPMVAPLYCPFFPTKFKIVNVWSPLRNSLLYSKTMTQCGHPLKGNGEYADLFSFVVHNESDCGTFLAVHNGSEYGSLS